MVKSWLLAIRPKTLPAAVVPVWAGCLLAWELEGVFVTSLALVTLLGALSIQIATNFFNDVIDADKGTDTDARLGPQRVTASGLIPRKVVLRGAFFMLVLASLCGLYLINARGWWIAVIGLPSLYLSYGYTGGPFPLAYRGMGEVFVILFFGLIATGGTVFVQLGHLPGIALIQGLQIGCLSAALIGVNNYRDVAEDRAAGKRTLAVRFGRPFARGLILTCSVLPYVLIPLVHACWFWWALPLGGVFFLVLWRGIRGEVLHNKWLGVCALHLILFIGLETVVMTLT